MRILLFCFLFMIACSTSKNTIAGFERLSEVEMLERNTTHETKRMQYKLISSKVNDKEDVWALAQKLLEGFDEEKYKELKPFVYERSINEIQEYINQQKLNYEQLTKWYIYRILKYESNPKTSLHSIISINPKAVEEAKSRDIGNSVKLSKAYGMPIILKDNIGFDGLATTAGALALSNNFTRDAKIVENLKASGAIILAKANLSEWAYFFCSGCPLGYSAIGGQTLNPYGRGVFESGGSSAGSGAVIAANYAAAAIGTETSGSILSPSSQNSLVGLKPTIGVLSRSGIVPISSTLDTPGPMTKYVSDNAIILAAMAGKDADDSATLNAPDPVAYTVDNLRTSISLFKFAVNTSYLESSKEYAAMVEKLKEAGATIIEITPEQIPLTGFVDVLHYDMKKDLPEYISAYAPRSVQVRTAADVVAFNSENLESRAPYGQELIEKTMKHRMDADSMQMLKATLEEESRKRFEDVLETQKVDAYLSINNYDAGYAAMAKYPALAIPMGYTEEGEPKALTLIGLPFSEQKLLIYGKTITDAFPMRKAPMKMEE